MKTPSTLALTLLVAALAFAGSATAERPQATLLPGVFDEGETVPVVRNSSSLARLAMASSLDDGIYTTALGGDDSGDLFHDQPIELVRNGRRSRGDRWDSAVDAMTRGNAEDSDWTIRLNAVRLWRTDPDNATLVTELDPPGGTTYLNANQFDFSAASGVELDVIRHNVGDTGWDLQGIAFNVDNMQDSVPTIPVTGAFVQYITPFGSTQDGFMRSSYESSLLSLELNARRQVGPEWLTLLAGVRYLQLDEELLIDISYDDGDGGTNPVNHRINSTNDLFGFQLGGEASLFENERWVVSALGKVGFYANRSGNSVLINHTFGPAPFTSEDDTVNPAFVSEAGLAAGYRITDYLSLRAKYQLLWVNDVALASDQVASSDPAFGGGTADVALDDVFFQSLFLGLEYLY